MPLVFNSLGADTQTHTYTHTDVHIKEILRNQARTSLWSAHAWFKNLTRQMLKASWGEPEHDYVHAFSSA